MAQFYNLKEQKHYKELNFSCKKCDWSGTGEQAKEGMDSNSGFPLLCPKCDEYIEWISIMVSLDELLKYGTEQDKADARRRQDFLNRVWASELKSPDQLPDIDVDEIIITLREEEKQTGSDDAYIVIYWKDKELWREVRSFEYYPRYLELGELLKEKYGERLIDFEAEHTVYLGGDSLTAFEKVDSFRKTLKRWKPMLGWNIWVAKTTGRKVGVGLVHWHVSDRKTDWIDDLVSQGKAAHIHDGRCPHTYHIKASDILPIAGDDDSLESCVGQIGYGDVPLLSGMFNGVWRDKETLAKCTPDEILCIELWDLQKIIS